MTLILSKSENNRSFSRAAILIPLYKESLSDAEEFSLKNAINILWKHDIYLIGPEKLRFFFENYRIQNQLKYKTALFPDKFFNSINGYNRLLMSKGFYKSFSNYEYILIAQTDSLVFSDQLEFWCNQNYSYIGAPWFVEAYSYTGTDSFENFITSQPSPVFLGVGNGGLSLRKTEDYIKFLSRPLYVNNSTLEWHFKGKLDLLHLSRKYLHKYLFSYNFPPLMPRVSEDIFWSLLVPERYNFFKVPSPEVALSFAFEANPEFLYHLNHKQLPFGCHAWEKHNKSFWENIFKELGLAISKSKIN